MNTTEIKSKPDSTAGQTPSGSLHSACSPASLRVLDAMQPGYFHSARGVAERAWEPVNGKYFGCRQGQWQSMGAMLSRLSKKGLVFRKLTPENQNLYMITSAGVQARQANSALSEPSSHKSTQL